MASMACKTGICSIAFSVMWSRSEAGRSQKIALPVRLAQSITARIYIVPRRAQDLSRSEAPR